MDQPNHIYINLPYMNTKQSVGNLYSNVIIHEKKFSKILKALNIFAAGVCGGLRPPGIPLRQSAH